MSGHSKWSTIKHKKAATDAKRGKIFTKIGREISVAVKEGGPSPDTNNKLKDVIAKARQNNMPNDNIQRTIKKASGELGDINYESITYEGYGIGGVAVIVETLTDNKNRTASDVRHAFDKNGGSLGSTGCVSYMFERKGLILVERDQADEDELMMCAIEAGADDFVPDEEVYEIYTSPEQFTAVLEALEGQKVPIASAEVSLIPQNYSTVEDTERIQKLLDMLEDNDDVQNVYHNCDNI